MPRDTITWINLSGVTISPASGIVPETNPISTSSEYSSINSYSNPKVSEDVEIGLVSGTIPEAGEIVTPDELIQVIVSLGIKIEVPEVEGLVYEDAINILEELGLVATVTGDTNGVVRKQIPRKGEFIEPEGVVELTFGS